MSSAGLFVIGVLVTLIVVAALAILFYAAVLDGRYADQQKLVGEDRGSPSNNGGPFVAPGSEVPTTVKLRKNIVETARDAGSFTTLLTAIDRAGLRAILCGEGPFTVFAPSDAAFDRLPAGTVESLLAEPGRLAEVLTYHLVPGRVTAADAATLTTAPTVHGEELPLSVDGRIHVDWASVVRPDIEATNGLIHIIDRVLLPASV